MEARGNSRASLLQPKMRITHASSMYSSTRCGRTCSDHSSIFAAIWSLVLRTASSLSPLLPSLDHLSRFDECLFACTTSGSIILGSRLATLCFEALTAEPVQPCLCHPAVRAIVHANKQHLLFRGSEVIATRFRARCGKCKSENRFQSQCKPSIAEFQVIADTQASELRSRFDST